VSSPRRQLQVRLTRATITISNTLKEPSPPPVLSQDSDASGVLDVERTIPA
jgi:hypothetical protein